LVEGRTFEPLWIDAASPKLDRKPGFLLLTVGTSLEGSIVGRPANRTTEKIDNAAIMATGCQNRLAGSASAASGSLEWRVCSAGKTAPCPCRAAAFRGDGTGKPSRAAWLLLPGAPFPDGSESCEAASARTPAWLATKPRLSGAGTTTDVERRWPGGAVASTAAASLTLPALMKFHIAASAPRCFLMSASGGAPRDSVPLAPPGPLKGSSPGSLRPARAASAVITSTHSSAVISPGRNDLTWTPEASKAWACSAERGWIRVM